MGWSGEGRGATVALAIVSVLVATLVPVAISLELAARQARVERERTAMHYARDVLQRSETIGEQVGRAFTRMQRLSGAGWCSPAELRELRAIDVSSSYLQLVGIVEGDAIVCSSYGLHDPPLPLGPPDYVSLHGASMRRNVRLPFARDKTFIVIGKGNFVAVVHKALPVDATITEPGVSLAIGAAAETGLLAVRGRIDPAWIPGTDEIPPGGQRTRTFGSTLVTQLRSRDYDLLAIAALDDRDYSSVVGRFAKIMVPFALLAGALLSWLLLRLIRAQRTLAAAIRVGLRNREFFIELQPIVDLPERQWVGAEVLVRWRRQDGELVRPDLFIAAAEEAGMIRQITARVLELAGPVLQALAARDDDFYLSINLSAVDLHHERIPDQLAALLARTGTRASQLHVEITERVFIDARRAGDQIDRIRALGIDVVIDDFGTGYSSLSGLIDAKMDALKIDKAFVDTIGSEAVTSHVAEHIVEMAHALELPMVAEGIETAHQAETLADWGVQYGQGWLFSKELSVDTFLSRLATSQ